MKLLPASPIEFLASCSRPIEPVYAAEVRGSLGTAVLAGTTSGLISVRLDVPLPYVAEQFHDTWGIHTTFDSGPFGSVIDDVAAYLDGESRSIHARVQPIGLSPFTIAVHETIARIPYGGTITYGDLAALIGHPGAARAVGGACRRNRVLLAVPCHRVIARHGLGGFGGNVTLKRRLLGFEGNHPPKRDHTA